MANQRSGTVSQYLVPRSILLESASTLRSLSAGVRESVVLWIGTHCSGNARVNRIVIPRQIASRKHFDVPLKERLDIAQTILQEREKLLVQLHTHPGKAFHSELDDRLALPRHTGAMSIVIANFAINWNGDLRQASVNLHVGGGVWTELDPNTVSALFTVS